MNRGVVAVASSLALVALLGACTDDKPPRGTSSAPSSAISSGSDQALARTMARTLADGFQQGAGGRISSAQADCLVAQITARIRTNDLSDISSHQPDPKSLPRNVRAAFGTSFDVCLPSDLAAQLRTRFGL